MFQFLKNLFKTNTDSSSHPLDGPIRVADDRANKMEAQLTQTRDAPKQVKLKKKPQTISAAKKQKRIRK